MSQILEERTRGPEIRILESSIPLTGVTPRVTEQFTVSSPRYNNKDKGRGGRTRIKVIDFLVSGSENIELLFRSLPFLVDWGIYLNDKGR